MKKSPRKKKCICNTIAILKQITGNPEPLKQTELNKIRLNLCTERNSDGTGHLVLRGKDIYDRYKRRITDADIKAICRYIKEEPRRITKVDLSYNSVTDVGFFKLLKNILVKARSSVINLNIMNNNITEASILNLAKYAQLVKLKYLRLNGNDFGVKGAEYFADFLKKNVSLQYCDIGQTNLTLTSVSHIITALRYDHGGNTTLKVLDLSRIIPSFNRYSYETKWLAYHLEYLLEQNSTIIELHLQKNQLIGHDVEYLDRGLRRNDTLLYLDLGYNRIGEYGAELLGKYLADRPQLIFLNLAGNGIKDTGARALSFGLPYSKIRALDVGHNKITDDGILDILNTLKKYYYLRFLNIWGNTITHESCVVIERMLISGALFQHTIDLKLYEVDDVLHAAYYPNPADRNKHLYYDELDYGCAQPVYHIIRNVVEEKKVVKVDCKQRHKLDKTDKNRF
ncbi:leucine-rich repeat-containing protein 34-like [Pararge aegeria]|uniref:Jg23368 protein n=1 Tax=Pararge aegeria aegeria TaxID=348720 RepID=A0A8S4RI43_9NEOP|nr:leucine-rich repeat-containing protein 34-like [Pararge aegeria]CAH2236906.1 jg23368 [Pararge aegeria aegeria]